MQARLTVPDPVPWPLPLTQPETGYSPLSIKRPNEISYDIAYCPADTTLDEMIRVARSRWAIEERFQTAKQECGLDDYPGPPIPRLAPPHQPVHSRPRLPDRPAGPPARHRENGNGSSQLIHLNLAEIRPQQPLNRHPTPVDHSLHWSTWR